jgi:hypothetical protein
VLHGILLLGLIGGLLLDSSTQRSLHLSSSSKDRGKAGCFIAIGAALWPLLGSAGTFLAMWIKAAREPSVESLPMPPPHPPATTKALPAPQKIGGYAGGSCNQTPRRRI